MVKLTWLVSVEAGELVDVSVERFDFNMFFDAPRKDSFFFLNRKTNKKVDA